jgi:hypothetical protein
MNKSLVCALVCSTSMAVSAASAATVQIPAARDNTLYQESPTFSNGAGRHIFAGTTAMADSRRALLAFDVAGSVPAGSTITAAELTLNMSKTVVGAQPVSLHRATSDWGESTSDAPGEEGIGTPAANGDATWSHTFFPSQLWSTPGGDFSATPSATAIVAQNGPYTWGSTPEMVADVQGWMDDPAANFGWVVVGDETNVPTAKRFDSRENPDPGVQPVLSVTFEGGTPVPAVSGAGIVLTALLVLAASAVVVYRRRNAIG